LHGAQTIVIVGQAGSQHGREPMPKANNHFAKNINRANSLPIRLCDSRWRLAAEREGALGRSVTVGCREYNLRSKSPDFSI
jgi:hypothetical protein